MSGRKGERGLGLDGEGWGEMGMGGEEVAREREGEREE